MAHPVYIIHIYHAYIQPIPPAVTFSKNLSKLMSLLTETWQKRRSSFELVALSFETAFENVTSNGIG